MRVAFKVGNLPSKFGHARPLGSRIIRYVRDGRTDRQTDGRTDKSNAYCPLPYGREHNKPVNKKVWNARHSMYNQELEIDVCSWRISDDIRWNYRQKQTISTFSSPWTWPMTFQWVTLPWPCPLNGQFICRWLVLVIVELLTNLIILADVTTDRTAVCHTAARRT